MASVFQREEQLHHMGEKEAPWYCKWREPDGRQKLKSFGTGHLGKKRAERHARKVEAELMTGTYKKDIRKKWKDFRKEYEGKIMSRMAPATKRAVNASLDHFERLLNLGIVAAINTGFMDEFIRKRREDRGKKKGKLVSVATINKDLRQLKAALRVAHDWGYLVMMPKMRFLKEPKKLPTFVTDEHFAAMLASCEGAKLPDNIPNISPADWWRALLIFAYFTGWRIEEILALRWDDVDMEKGSAITRYSDNKGSRDDRTKLNPVVVEHIAKIRSFGSHVFPWDGGESTLYKTFHRLQERAKIHLPCKIPEEHEHTDACHVYGFHDFRRAFATMNAGSVPPELLQKLMRHKAYATTQIYINMAEQMDDVVANLHVPEFLKKKAEGEG